MQLIPVGMRGYRRAWIAADVVAGLTLAAVSIPEVMGYTSISQTPIVTGLYTVIFPTLAFALLGASRLLVVGADSATAAILAAGLLATAILDLIDIAGLRAVYARRRSEFGIAVLGGIVVFAWGVEQGIVVAIVVSLIEIIRRQYRPADFVVVSGNDEVPQYVPAAPGCQSEPGLVVFRYDAELFYANANRFVDDVETLVEHAPDPVEWLVLDAASIDDIDYSAGIALAGLLDWLDARRITAAVARADARFLHLLAVYGLERRIPQERVYANLQDAVAAFRSWPPAPITPR